MLGGSASRAMSDKWIPQHDALNAAFDSGSILTASREELERHLLTTSETRILGEPNMERNERRASAIRHLLQVRVTERIAQRTFRISMAALIISVVAVTFAGLKFWQELSARPPASSPPTLSSTPTPQSPAPKGVSP